MGNIQPCRTRTDNRKLSLTTVQIGIYFTHGYKRKTGKISYPTAQWTVCPGEKSNRNLYVWCPMRYPPSHWARSYWWLAQNAYYSCSIAWCLIQNHTIMYLRTVFQKVDTMLYYCMVCCIEHRQCYAYLGFFVDAKLAVSRFWWFIFPLRRLLSAMFCLG